MPYGKQDFCVEVTVTIREALVGVRLYVKHGKPVQSGYTRTIGIVIQ